MEIIRKSRDFSASEMVHFVQGSSEKMKSCIGSIVPLDDFLLYKAPNHEGEIQTVLAVKSGNMIYATISKTFISDFVGCVEMFESCGEHFNEFFVAEGTSKNGRKFIKCEAV